MSTVHHTSVWKRGAGTCPPIRYEREFVDFLLKKITFFILQYSQCQKETLKRDVRISHGMSHISYGLPIWCMWHPMWYGMSFWYGMSKMTSHITWDVTYIIWAAHMMYVTSHVIWGVILIWDVKNDIPYHMGCHIYHMGCPYDICDIPCDIRMWHLKRDVFIKRDFAREKRLWNTFGKET